MLANETGLYAAFKAKDRRFDGRFFVGISSTGIYCRPVCRAKMPKEENCHFFATAAEAEQAGFRPCLLCRPELAPGLSIIDASAALARKAARLLEENCGTGINLEELAEKMGCSDRHLRRVFSEEYNVTLIQYLQTCRLLLAKSLLQDTNLPIVEVAMAAGFGSLSRFNDLFKKQYKLSPTALRKGTSQEERSTCDVSLLLCYRPPYLWDRILKFLADRAITGVDLVRDDTYWRTVRLENGSGQRFAGWIQVGHVPKKNALCVTVSETLLPVLSQVLARVRRLFDIYCDPEAVYEVLQTMNKVRPGLCVPGTRVPGCFDSFEIAVRTVLGQQITVKAAKTLAARLVAVYGNPIQTGIEGLTHLFPSPEDVVALGENIEESFGTLGVIAARSRTIFRLAEALVDGELSLEPSAELENEMKKLLNIQGIGPWSAQYMAMRTMEWPDAFLDTDAGVRKALGSRSSKEMQEMAEAWRPWRSYATVNLWNTL